MNLSRPGVARRLRTRTLTMPDGPRGSRYRQAVPAGFVFQPVPLAASKPPGMIASSTRTRVVSSSMMRTPFVAGSMGGVTGTVITPLNLRRSSPGGVFRFRILTRCLIANTGTMLLQGSHASPMPSPSLSSCAGSGLFGQSSIRPSQLSATSQGPALGRHTAVLFASAGHSASVPVQVSAGSHAPAEARHSTVAGAKASAGQSSFTPSQLSATSQGPALARHSAVLFASAGQAASVPVQVSAGSHTPADGRHSTVAGAKASGGQETLVPVQVSATSQPPAAARHSVPALASG